MQSVIVDVVIDCVDYRRYCKPGKLYEFKTCIQNYNLYDISVVNFLDKKSF